MKASAIYTLLVAASLSLPAVAQTPSEPRASDAAAPAAGDSTSGASRRPANQQYDAGGSKHCDTMTGAERDQCLQDEGAKTDSKAEPSSAASGGDAPKSDRGTPATPAAGSPAGE
jgi:hypothetical protein